MSFYYNEEYLGEILNSYFSSDREPESEGNGSLLEETYMLLSFRALLELMVSKATR